MHYDILIVDDNPDDLELCQRSLARMGDTAYHVRTATNGNDALELIQTRQPDCVLLDYSLPGQDGIAVLKRIVAIDPLIPVIMLTGQGNESLAVRAMKEGALDYIAKSAITPGALHRSVALAIESASQEYKIIEQRQHIERQSEELERINEELETFTYIASHDLRSPLVNLRGFCGELHRSVDVVIPMLENIIPKLGEADGEILRKEIFQRIPKSLAYIVTAAEKMDRMTEAILKLSRLGRKKIELEALSTREIVDQCVKALTHQIEHTHTVVEIGDLPGVVCDRVALEQIFGNLLDNAIKYLDPSRPGKIRISGSRDRDHTTFEVEDNGRGIAQDDLHKVFEIFRRAGDVGSIPGEGMGMPYVRSIVRRYGGHIWCESAPGKGTTFFFTLAHQAAEKEAA